MDTKKQVQDDSQHPIPYCRRPQIYYASGLFRTNRSARLPPLLHQVLLPPPPRSRAGLPHDRVGPSTLCNLVAGISPVSPVSRAAFGASQSPAAESLISIRRLLCVRPAGTHSTQGQVTLLSLLRPTARVTTCNHRRGGTAAWACLHPLRRCSGNPTQMRVTSWRVIIRVSHNDAQHRHDSGI